MKITTWESGGKGGASCDLAVVVSRWRAKAVSDLHSSKKEKEQGGQTRA